MYETSFSVKTGKITHLFPYIAQEGVVGHNIDWCINTMSLAACMQLAIIKLNCYTACEIQYPLYYPPVEVEGKKKFQCDLCSQSFTQTS